MKKVRYWRDTGKTLKELVDAGRNVDNRESHGEWLDLKAETEKTKQITFWPEGSLIKTGGVPFWEEYEGAGGKRGEISGFSGKAQRRMMEWIAKLKRDDLPTFLMVTYPREWPEDPETWKVHLNHFCIWLEREYGDVCQLWKLEDQERGAPHFHELVWGAEFIPWQHVAIAWACIIHGDTFLRTVKRPRPVPGRVGAWIFREWVRFLPVPQIVKDTLVAGVRVEKIRSAKGVKSYISKYMAKKSGDLSAQWAHVGRFWGVRGRKNAPKSVEITYCVTKAHWIKFRRLGRRFMRSKGYKAKEYSLLLTDHPFQWVRALDLIESGSCDAADYTQWGIGPRPVKSGPGWDEWLKAGNVVGETLDGWDRTRVA